MSDVGYHPLVIRKGRSFRLKFTYKVDNVVVDLTGYEARMMVKSSATDTAALPGFNLSSENGDIVLGGAEGTVEVTVALVVTAALADFPKVGVYDVVLIPPTGPEKGALEGQVTFVQSVTTL